MATFDLIFNILKWAGSVVGSIFGFLFSLTTLSPGAVFVLLIMIAPIVVGIAQILKNWLAEREGE
jgi:hypothetical protein